MIRKITMFVMVMVCCLVVKSQSLADVKKQIYLEQYTAAKLAAKELIASGNSPSEASYLLVEIYLKEKDILSASDVLLAFPGQPFTSKEEIKEHPLLNVALGHVLLDSGQSTAARAKFESVLEAGKYKDPATLLAVAKANIASKQGDAQWAVELLNKALKKDKSNAELYVALGDAYRKMTDGGMAISNYNKALSVEPGFAEALYKTGMIYKTQNNAGVFLEKFLKTYAVDSTYTPVIYELYYYYYFRDVEKADQYLQAYLRHTAPSPESEYMIADLKFVSRKYTEAIASGKRILEVEGDKTAPRIYKLIAYSYAELGDSAAANSFMDSYLTKQEPNDFVAKDFILKAKLLENAVSNNVEPVSWYLKALEIEEDSTERLVYMNDLANMYKSLGQRDNEAEWREKIVNGKNPPANIDLYNWGMAVFASEQYHKSDSVFALYAEKYPEEVYGYLWRARSNALIDTTMELGLAVPFYKKLIEVAGNDSAKNKALLLRSFQYLGSYEANITRDFASSLGYYNKILELNPADADAERSVSILTRLIEKGGGSK